jgi:PAS domain S-box-containing protein
LYGISQNIILISAVKTDQKHMQEDVERFQEALSLELSNLDSIVNDWASWDDTYAFIEDNNTDYVSSNLVDGTFTNLKLNLMLFVNSSDQFVFGKAFDLLDETEVHLPESLVGHISDWTVLLDHSSAGSYVKGIILLAEGPMLVASRPILPSDDEGPIRGALIMGRYLDSERIGYLSLVTHLSLATYVLGDSEMPSDFYTVSLSMSNNAPVLIQNLDDETIAGYVLLDNILGNPILMLRVDAPRSSYAQAQVGLFYFAFSLIVVGAGFAAVTVLLLEEFIVSRLRRLSERVSAISKSGDVSERVKVSGKDELSSLAGEINNVLEAVKKKGDALQESEKRFKDVASSTGEWMWETDDKGRYVYSSPVVEQLLGYKPSEVIGKFFYDFFCLDDREQLKSAAFETFRRKEPFVNLINRNMHKDGHVVTLETSGVPILSDDGKLLGYRGADRDVTERKRLEERLSALNLYGKKLNTANSLDEIYELTLDAMEQVLGFELAEFLVVRRGSLAVACERGYSAHLGEVPLDGTVKAITVKAANQRIPIIVPNVRKDKDYFETDSQTRSELAVPIVVEDEVVAVLNVESRKLAAFGEKDVELLQILASHISTAISNMKKRKEIENRSLQQLLLLKSSAELIHSAELHQRLQVILNAIRGLGWRRVVLSVRGQKLDIERRDNIVTAGLTEEEREYLWVNRQPGQVWKERFGSEYERFKIGEFYYLPWSDPWVRDRFDEGTVPSKLSPKEMVDWDPQDLLYAPLRLADGRIVGVVSMDDPVDGKRPTKGTLAPLELFLHLAAIAIENAKLMQQVKGYAEHLEEKVEQRTRDLKKSEEKLKSIFSASPDAITATDLNGKIVECSKQTLKMHGYSSEKELIGKNGFMLISKKDHQRAMENLQRTLVEGSTKNVEYTFVTKGGHEFAGELSASLVRDSRGDPRGFVIVTKDITERKQMEQRLLKSERLAAIGELAGMVGHDLRNPLTGIASASYYVKKKLKSKVDSKTREMLELIERDIEASNKIITDLLEYSREMKLELAETDLGSLVRETISSLKVPLSIKIVNSVKSRLSIEVDEERMRRVFINIIKNAFDAMPKGGTITLKSVRTDGKVAISISDTGSGMSKETIRKLWTPLFTTKAKGMGFGLAICKRIVEAHRGKITVETAVGKGTTFTITIPTSPEAEENQKAWVDIPEPILSSTNE